MSIPTSGWAITFADGLVHVIDDNSIPDVETIFLLDGPGGTKTQLDVVVGGRTGIVIASEHSVVNLLGGAIGGEPSASEAFDEAVINLVDGSTGEWFLHADSQVNVSRIEEGPLGRYFGTMTLSEIDEWKIRKYIKSRQTGDAGPATINRDLARLSNLWNSARRRKLVEGDNPVAAVGRLKEPPPRVRYLSANEEERLLAGCVDWLRPIVEVALHTGIRRGALLGLCWRHVDRATGLIEVPHDLSKSGDPYYVAMNERVDAILRNVRAQSRCVGPNDFLFPKRDGSRRRDITNAFCNARKRAKVENFRFHDTRHDCASKIVQAGGTLLDAAEQLGHKTLSMTKRYAHLSPERRKKVASLTMRRREVVALSGLHSDRGPHHRRQNAGVRRTSAV